MNLPNKITISRIILIIGMIISMFVLAFIPDFVAPDLGDSGINLVYLIFTCVFIIAAFTDFLDGHIARSRNLVTTFGKFMDPIADKLLVNTLFIILGVWGEVPAICVIIFIARDTIVDAIRMIAVERQKVIAASKLGKLKTVAQMVAIILMLLQVDKLLFPVGTIFVYIAAACSLISGIDYFWKNKHIVLEGANYRG